MKARVIFDDITLVNNCRFFAKIGLNTDDFISGKYVMFCYGSDKSDKSDKALRVYAKKFPYAELILGLEEDGGAKKNCIITRLVEQPVKEMVIQPKKKVFAEEVLV